MCGLAQTCPTLPSIITGMANLDHTHFRSAGSDFGSGGSATSALTCPMCGSSVYRIRRKTIDRILSLVAPTQRFRCRANKANFACTWEGVIQLKDMPLQSNAEYPPHDHPRGRTAAIPKPSQTFGDLSFDNMAQITLDAIGDAVLVVNPQGTVIYLNKVAETMTGWSQTFAIGRPVGEVFRLIDSTSRQRLLPPSQRAINENRIVDLALGSVLVRHDGSEIPIEDSAAPIRNAQGKISGAVIIFHGAEKSQSHIEKMSYLAQHDPLTGLPNRALIAERLTQALGMAKRHNKQLALLFVDLDRFKLVNDTFGHTIGDYLLLDVAQHMLRCVRTTDTVSRFGGDEFVILLPEIEDGHDAARVAEKLLAGFTQPRTICGQKLKVTLSIGISVYPDDGPDAGTLMEKADAAMYRNKEGNRTPLETARQR
jgi:diguanylate cyclase (GGDEF)-like protein/PAS domain S-box-containing protein